MMGYRLADIPLPLEDVQTTLPFDEDGEGGE